ncbi:Uncharacterised protein [Moraxella caviae]|nr:Uncharacterised protein [Moraxella caviae]VEW12716.1 Uncharacterised protein [Moraxella caviae]
MPFYHLKSEPFWELRAKDCEDFHDKTKMKSLNNLKAVVNHARLEQGLAVCLSNPSDRQRLYDYLVWRYFTRSNQQQQEGIKDKVASFVDKALFRMWRDFWELRVA